MLHIGKNQLSQNGMVLDFEAENIKVKGEFNFGEFQTIKRSFLKPNIMGWLSYFPNECNHSIVSMKHSASGRLKLGESEWELLDADAYLEKDWGTGFPEEYVWAQANDWEDSSLVFSYASVPMLGKYRKGFFLLLHHQGVEYRFSSIEGSRMVDFQVSGDAFEAKIVKGKYSLTLRARQANPVKLVSPENGDMKAHIKESLDGNIDLSLQISGKDVVSLSSKRASIDVHFKAQ